MRLKWWNKEKWIKIKSSNFIIYFIIAVLMSVVFCMVYGVQVLNPTYTDWLMASGNDLTQHYLGWKAYRLSNCDWSIGITNLLAYPTETSVIFTDSIPCFAILFKALSPVLPKDFQYFGLWGILCFILQGVLSARIIGRFTKSKTEIILASLLFAFVPVMIFRMFMHTAMAGHWLLLLALEPLFAYRIYYQNNKIYIIWALIGGLSIAIHTYFLLMCGMILIGYCFIDMAAFRRIRRSLFCLILYLCSALIMLGVLGGFSTDFAKTASHLGDSSLNINALFNPQNWSCIYQDLDLYGKYQYEGFAYLGAGCILLLFFSMVVVASSIKVKDYVKKYYTQIGAITFTFIVAFVFALSPKITYGEKLVWEFELPSFIEKCWAVFRSTGRFVWVCVYILMICSCIICYKCFEKKAALIIMTLCVLLQIYDLHDVLSDKNKKFNQIVTYETLLTDTTFWSQLGVDNNIKNIVLTKSVSNEEIFAFTDWALDNGKTVNRFYFARSLNSVINYNLQNALSEPTEADIFIFFEDNKAMCLEYDFNYYLVNGYIVGYIKELPYGVQLPEDYLLYD